MRTITGRRVLVGVGTTLVALALALLVRALFGGHLPLPSLATVGVLVVLVGLVAAAWKVRARPRVDEQGASQTPYLRAGRYRLVDGQPEATDLGAPLAGGETASLLTSAAASARAAGRVEAGLADARPLLRETARAILVTSGDTSEAAERAIDTGSWTTDAEVAAVLAPELTPPPRPLQSRVRAWLRPGRVARERLARTVGALARTADERLPPVVGRDAPRRVQVTPPPIATLERAVDGTVRPARTPPPDVRSVDRTVDEEGS